MNEVVCLGGGFLFISAGFLFVFGFAPEDDTIVISSSSSTSFLLWS